MSAAAKSWFGVKPPRSEPFAVLYRSPRFIVIDKPAGLAVHAGRAGGPSVEDAFDAWRRPGRDGPWLAHRLDADTSGCLLIGLRKQSLVAAQACFAERRVRKTYWAIVHGRPEGASGRIDLALGRREDRTGWRMVADARGAPASTLWRCLGSDGTRSFLELELLTGRTHQARAHCAALGCPITGDSVYGPAVARTGLRLLSRRLRLAVGDEVIDAVATPPDAMARTIAGLAPT